MRRIASQQLYQPKSPEKKCLFLLIHIRFIFLWNCSSAVILSEITVHNLFFFVAYALNLQLLTLLAYILPYNTFHTEKNVISKCIHKITFLLYNFMLFWRSIIIIIIMMRIHVIMKYMLIYIFVMKLFLCCGASPLRTIVTLLRRRHSTKILTREFNDDVTIKSLLYARCMNECARTRFKTFGLENYYCLAWWWMCFYDDCTYMCTDLLHVAAH